jgi:hypothetical protein
LDIANRMITELGYKKYIQKFESKRNLIFWLYL